MKKVEEAAQLAAARMHKDGLMKQVAFDPAMVLVLVQVVAAVVGLLRSCRSDARSAHQMLKSPGVVGKVALRSVVADVLKDHPAQKSYAANIRTALLEVGRESELKSVEGLMKEE